MAESAAGFRLLSKYRLKKRSEFLSVQQEGRKLYSRNFLFFLRKNEIGHPRIGVTVSRKVDKRAVVRNRIKRYVKETLRHLVPRIALGVDLVVIARLSASETTFLAVKSELIETLTAKRVLDAPPIGKGA